ncbi:MAG: hypothetical protein K0U93_24245 [Gammaproteobacteria bacterium]|nr:hypothetical protein [Gammaproteobacteria bacterium]
MLRAIALSAFVALGGCAHLAAITCVPNVEYSEKTQERAAAELETMGENFPTVRRMVTDYGNTREANRRCAARRGVVKQL